MAYIEKIYTYPDGTIEVEKVHAPRYGKRTPKGERRAPSSEEVQKVNERNVIKKLRRLIKMNFSEGDYHLVLTYRRDERPTPEEAVKIINKFLTKLRKTYKSFGHQLKYILVTEYENKAIHHHLIINDIPGAAKKVRELWIYGRPRFTVLDGGDYGNLAAYLIKETRETFRDRGSPSRLRYSRSRNMVIPEPKVSIIKARSWRENPKPKKGYVMTYLKNGTDVFGYPYQYYTMTKVVNPTYKKREAG